MTWYASNTTVKAKNSLFAPVSVSLFFIRLTLSLYNILYIPHASVTNGEDIAIAWSWEVQQTIVLFSVTIMSSLKSPLSAGKASASCIS